MSAVTMRTFPRPRSSARARMHRACGAELETAVILEAGYRSAIHRVREPHPQPSSRMSWPSARSARFAVISSASASASSRVTVSGDQWQQLYLRWRPSTASKNCGGNS